jgi:hypothetical protein
LRQVGDVGAVETDLPGARPQCARHQFDKGRLAGVIRAPPSRRKSTALATVSAPKLLCNPWVSSAGAFIGATGRTGRARSQHEHERPPARVGTTARRRRPCRGATAITPTTECRDQVRPVVDFRHFICRSREPMALIDALYRGAAFIKSIFWRARNTILSPALISPDTVHNRNATLSRSMRTVLQNRPRPVVGEGVRSCPRAQCGKSACCVRLFTELVLQRMRVGAERQGRLHSRAGVGSRVDMCGLRRGSFTTHNAAELSDKG